MHGLRCARPHLRLKRPKERKGRKYIAIDVLLDVLSMIRLRGNIVGIYTFPAPWGFEIAPNKTDIIFAMILQGQSILEMDEEGIAPQSLKSGDIIVLPWGSRYTLRDSWQTLIMRTIDVHTVPNDDVEVGSQQTGFVIGCYHFTNGGRDTLNSVLPPLIHLRKEDYQPHQDLDLLMRLFTKQAMEKEAAQAAIWPAWRRCSFCSCFVCMRRGLWRARGAD